MRAYGAVTLLATIIGLIGAWSLWDAATQYTGTLRTYRQLAVTAEPGSFVWLDAEFQRARVDVVLTNHSPADATVDTLDLHLLFDGEFAGSNYSGYSPTPVSSGEARTVRVELQVTAGSLQPQGGTATLALGGAITARFGGIDRPLTLNVRAPVGQVGWVGP